MFFIGQNLNHVHMTYSFLELLIFFWLTQVDTYCLEIISYHITEILYLDTISKGNQSGNKNKHFHLFLSWNKNKYFHLFLYKVKIPCEQLSLIFSQFHEYIFRSGRSQMFFKIGALKDFAMFWIKNRLLLEVVFCKYC